MTAPDIVTMLIVLSTVSVLGVALDKLVLSNRLDEWRGKVSGLWVKLNTAGATGLIQDANTLYCDLFDYIYGAKPFSWKRVRNSILSTLISGALIVLIIGPTNTFLYRYFKSEMFVGFFVIIGLLNFLPDFLSLIETRFVLRWSRRSGPMGILGLLLLDIILTTLLFVGYAFAAGMTITWSTQGLVWPTRFVSWLITPSECLVPFLTTFVTSFFWWLFVGTFLVIWFFYRVHPVTRYVYQAVGQSERPATAISGFLNILIIGVYLLWVVAENLIAVA